MYCTKINLPLLTSSDHIMLEQCFYGNIKSAKSPTTKTSVYLNLYSFLNKDIVFDNIFKKYNFEERYIKNMSIQQIIGDEFKPHKDVARHVTAIYTLKGYATTSFYKKENSNMIEDATYNMNLHEWYLFNNKEFHGVKNIDNRERISLVIDLTHIFYNFENALNKMPRIFYKS